MTDDNDEVVLDEEEQQGGSTEGSSDGSDAQNNQEGLANGDHEDDDDEEGSAGSSDDGTTAAGDDGADDAEREAIRERRRLERQEKKQKAREREESLRRELRARDALLEEARARLDALERKNQGTEVAHVEAAMKQTSDAYNYFKGQIELATKEQNGAALAEATEKMIMARQKFNELNNLKNTLVQRQQQPSPLDPRTVSYANEWMSRNKWYDPRGNTPESRAVLDEDDRLAKEGWNPSTPEYWQELDSRLKNRLPRRPGPAYNGKQQEQQKPTTPNAPRGTVAGSGRESSGGSSKNSFKLSPERVAAIKEAGMWDDPTQRAEMIKEFQNYDAAQRRA